MDGMDWLWLEVLFCYVYKWMKRKEKSISNLHGMKINGLMSWAEIHSPIGMDFGAWQNWYQSSWFEVL